jgi:methylenetetrahydrofolate dehydrogenase (NADP+)/methenyltetrahydrofolate cyclohydrolase
MSVLMDGKLVSSSMRETIKNQVENYKSKYNSVPGLAVVVVGNNPASAVYVRNKHKACAEVGINSIQIELPETISEKALIDKIRCLNTDPDVHGILVQLPLPKHIDEKKILNVINPIKDVDAFHPENVGRIIWTERKNI